MEKKQVIYIFRHGQTTFNRDGKFTGFIDAKLTKKGIVQAKKIANILKNKKFQVAFYTRLSRSKDTLKYVLKEHPECKKLIKDDRMIERNYGVLNGKTHNEFIKKFGKKEYDLIHRAYNHPPKKGESFKIVEKRVANFIKFLIPFMKKNKVSVAISGHGNSIRLFRKIMEKTSTEKMIKWEIPYDKVFTYKV